MRIRILLGATAAIVVLLVSAAPALARWLTSSDPYESTGASLRVADVAKVSRDGWTVRWKVQINCPRGETITGSALIAERDPRSIPQLAGEDQGITATQQLSGTGAERCTGHRQTLRLVLRVADTVVFDPATGTTVTLHEPIHRAPGNRTTAAVTLSSSPDSSRPFFVQYCAAPNCASESGPRVTLR